MKSYVKYLKFLANLLMAGVLGIVVFVVAPRLLQFFMPLVIGWVIALIANPLVRLLERKVKIVRKYSSMMIIITALAVVIIGAYFIIAKIIQQVVGFVTQLDDIYIQIQSGLLIIGQRFERFFGGLPDNIQNYIVQFLTNAEESINNFIGSIGVSTFSNAAGNFAKNIPTVLISIIFTILSAYFFIAKRDHILEAGRKKTPQSIQRNWQIVIGNFRHVVGGYFKAQFKIMGVVAGILFIALLVLRIKFAFILALLIALLDALPFFGTGTALIPWGIYCAMTGDIVTGLGLLATYLISQLIRQVIQPKIVGDSIGLDPLASLIFMFIGYKLSGVFGMIIAVPLGVIIINLFKSGLFDSLIKSAQLAFEDFNKFRKV